MSTIVVGVDGSPGSRAALAWAVEEARVRGSAIRAVHAWTVPVVAAPTYGFAAAAASSATDYEEYEQLNRRILDEMVDEVAGDDSGVAIERVLVSRAPSETLIAEARSAELLVVGSRGLGGFKELLLGSVSHQCAIHAPCPVVIIRDRARS